MKGFGLAVQQASPRAGKQSSVPAHHHTNPHATLQEQRGPQQKKKKSNPVNGSVPSFIPASDWITDCFLSQ